MSRQSEKELRLRDAMSSLVSNENFQVFMETIQELKDGAVDYAVGHTTVRDQRESLAALGEVRAYTDILAIFRAHREPVANQVVGEQEG
jgi:hypothetical protein